MRLSEDNCRETGRPARFLIAGVGNLLRRDDGVGVHAALELQERPLPGVRVVEIGTAILHGLGFVESAERVLVIDAAHGGRAPGSIYLFDASSEMETKAMTSLHALGLREAVRLLGRGQPPPITVIGVEPQTLGYGMELSTPVRTALPRVVKLARETVLAWAREETGAETRGVRDELMTA